MVTKALLIPELLQCFQFSKKTAHKNLMNFCPSKGQLILKLNCRAKKFSQKTNKQICFSILRTQQYLKLKFWFQVSSISEWQDGKTNSFVCFLGGGTAQHFCFQIYWPLVTWLQGQKSIRFLLWSFGKLKTPNSHSEINWPLASHLFTTLLWPPSINELCRNFCIVGIG